MNTFSFKRFAQVLRWYLVQNKDTLLRWTTGSVIGIFLFQVFGVVIGMGSGYIASVNFTVNAAAFLLSIAVLVAASSTFDFAKTKQRRIALLSLPASNGEKYASALVYSLIVWPLCMLLALVVGDLLRASLLWLIGLLIAETPKPFYSGLPNCWETFCWFSSLSFFVTNLWSVSLYLLGGSLFRRSQFVITSGFLFFLFILAIVGLHCLPDASMDWIETVWNQNQQFQTIMTAVLLTLAILNFFLSYRCFCRMQAVSGKWLNTSLHK